MADIAGLARAHTDLGDPEVELLRELTLDWGLIADLSFADLVLWLPTWNGGGYVAVAQQRPDTGRTLFPDDIVGEFTARGRRPGMAAAQASGRPQDVRDADGTWAQIYPVAAAGRVIALLGRYSAVEDPAAVRAAGGLEAAYLAAADDLCAMVVSGDFPPGGREHDPLRVGSGLMRLDADGLVEFASPNATSAFRRLGVAVDLVGTDMGRLAPRLHDRADGLDPAGTVVAAGRTRGQVELEHSSTVLVLESLPLIRRGRRTGALLLVRDVTELRSRERALLSSEASLREVHHRIKNNLQLVAALLRMQSRRSDSESARAALADAGSRVSAIAVVHEALAAAPEGTADFDAVADRILAMSAALAPGARLRRSGSIGPVPADQATPLAMCLAELLANALEHAGPQPTVAVVLRQDSERIGLEVVDDGPGLPAGFDPASDGRLGLQIVRTLAAEHGGHVLWAPGADGGTVAEVAINRSADG